MQGIATSLPSMEIILRAMVETAHAQSHVGRVVVRQGETGRCHWQRDKEGKLKEDCER